MHSPAPLVFPHLQERVYRLLPRVSHLSFAFQVVGFEPTHQFVRIILNSGALRQSARSDSSTTGLWKTHNYLLATEQTMAGVRLAWQAAGVISLQFLHLGKAFEFQNICCSIKTGSP